MFLVHMTDNSFLRVSSFLVCVFASLESHLLVHSLLLTLQLLPLSFKRYCLSIVLSETAMAAKSAGKFRVTRAAVFLLSDWLILSFYCVNWDCIFGQHSEHLWPRLHKHPINGSKKRGKIRLTRAVVFLLSDWLMYVVQVSLKQSNS